MKDIQNFICESGNTGRAKNGYIWHNYNDPIDVNKIILIIAPNGNSSLAKWNGKSLLTKTLEDAHWILCKGDKWAYIEDLMKTQK